MGSAEPVKGTATFSRSANRIISESTNWLELPLAAVSKLTLATAAVASFRLTACNSSSISNGNSASRIQYSITTSGLAAHSSSILEASTSILCRSESSGNNNLATYDKVSRCGRMVMRVCHQASTTLRPATFHARLLCRFGINPVRPRLYSDSDCSTLPQPNNAALRRHPPFLLNSSVRSRSLGKSKLSIL